MSSCRFSCGTKDRCWGGAGSEAWRSRTLYSPPQSFRTMLGFYKCQCLVLILKKIKGNRTQVQATSGDIFRAKVIS